MTRRPPRITGARLLRMVRAVPRFREPQVVHAVVPYTAIPVLGAVCAGIADSGELGVYRPIPALAGLSVAVAIGARMGVLGAETQIASDLGALIGVGMVVELDDGSLTLPLDFAALAEAAAGGAAAPVAPAAAARLRDVGGRPRRGEDARQRRLRLLASMPTGPAETSRETEVSRVSGAEVSEAAKPRGIGHGNLAAVPETGFEPRAGGSSLAAAAVFKEESIDSTLEEQQQQLKEDAPARTETGVSGFEVSGVSVSEVSGPAATGVSGNLGPSADAVADGDAGPRGEIEPHLLALEAHDVLGIKGSRGTKGTELARQWLAMTGMTRQEICAVAREKKRAHDRRREKDPTIEPIGSLDFLTPVLRARCGLPPEDAPEAAAAAAPKPGFPAVPAHISTAGLDGHQVNVLAGSLYVIGTGDRVRMQECLARARRTSPRVLELVLQEHPELRDLAGAVQYRASG